MNNILAQSNAISVRLAKHKEHGEYFADTGERTRIDLNDRDCVRLEDPLKHYASMCVFTCGNTDTDGFEFTPDAGMTKGAVERMSFM